MIFRMFNLGIDAADRSQFNRVGQHNLLTSLQDEAGTLTMYSTHADAQGTDNYIFEVYADDAAYQVHAHSPQFQEFSAMAKKTIKKRAITQLKPLFLFEQPTSFIILSGRSVVKLRQLTVDDQQLAKLKTTVFPKLQQAVQKDSDFLACLIGRDQDDPQRLVILTNYRTAVAADRHEDLLPGTAISLTPETIVSHGGLAFQE